MRLRFFVRITVAVGLGLVLTGSWSAAIVNSGAIIASFGEGEKVFGQVADASGYLKQAPMLQSEPTDQIILEGEAGSGPGKIMPRSRASGQRTVLLYAGQSREIVFETDTSTLYEVSLLYSNNHDDRYPPDTVYVSIDGQSVGNLQAEDTYDWNTFASSDPIGTIHLEAGNHTAVFSVSGGDSFGVEVDAIVLDVTGYRCYLPIIMKEWKQPTSWAVNNSACTTCAEDDNINIPLFAEEVNNFQVVATHPTYGVGTDNCNADFSGCPSGNGVAIQTADSCEKPGTFADVEVCTVADWWRPYNMTVVVGDAELSGHYLRWYKTIEGSSSAPQFLVLYQDGYMRLKPHPPVGISDTCFGSSVIIGPAPLADRPYVDIEKVTVDLTESTLDIVYRAGGSAHLKLSVNRDRAVANVGVNYDGSKPFATFRSMYVSDGNADVDQIRTGGGDLGFFSQSPHQCDVKWNTLPGTWWFFHRAVHSKHNTSAPDIRIEVLN